MISDIEGARVLAILGDSVTTDHISPAGSFKAAHPAGAYLRERQVPTSEFNSYGSRRGNHEVMMRGTFANIRIRNEMLDGVEGGYTLGPDGRQVSIYDAAMAWQAQGVPLVVIAGKEYGTGSSRDWAAKGTALLGVKAVIAESFERIHRSNLVGMGVIPFEFTGGDDRKTLGFKGDEVISIGGLAGELRPLSEVPATIVYGDGTRREVPLKCRIDTAVEIEYVENGGRAALRAAQPRQGRLRRAGAPRARRRGALEGLTGNRDGGRLVLADRSSWVPDASSRSRRTGPCRGRAARAGAGQPGRGRALHQPGMLLLPAGGRAACASSPRRRT